MGHAMDGWTAGGQTDTHAETAGGQHCTDAEGKRLRLLSHCC